MVVQRFADPRGGRVAEALVDGQRRAQLHVAFAVITGLDTAAAEAFPGPRLFDRCAEIARDGQRRSVILFRLAASRAPEP